MTDPKPGDEIQYKAYPADHSFAGQRLGSAELKTVTYVSDSWIAFNTYSADGRFIRESVKSRRNFDESMELKPKRNEFHVGQQYETTTGRLAEIVAVDVVTVHSTGEDLTVFGYRFVGGSSAVYLRSASEDQVHTGWVLQNP